MRGREAIRFVIDIEVTDTERFRALTEEAVAITREEDGVPVYDWYLDEEGGRARLYEAYESLDALEAHVAGPVFSEVGPRLLETCRFVTVEAYGDVPEAMRAGPTLAPTTWWGGPVAAVSGS
jgi:quinol monooxygenase YgiN